MRGGAIEGGGSIPFDGGLGGGSALTLLADDL
jgi:hypothetical protein